MFYGLDVAELLSTVSWWALGALVAYTVIRFAVKHGMRDAMNERDRRTATSDAAPDAPGWTVEWPDE
jgi:purine-cytosine permease-like protein